MNTLRRILNNKSSRFYSIIISSAFVALTSIGVVSYSFYLDDYSHSFAEMFKLQNANLIESNNALELGERLEASKKSGAVKCIFAKSGDHIFYRLGKSDCESGLFSRAVTVKASGLDNFVITFEISLPWKVRIAFMGFLILNLLVFLVAYLWILSHENLKQKAQEDLAELAKQVAHDIRSPLSALNMVSGTLTEVPEAKRLMIRNAVQRINDIANDLLSRGKQADAPSKEASNSSQASSSRVPQTEVILLPALVDAIVSEKRIQFRDQINVRVDADFKDSFGSFVKAESKELQRLLSNLINNSVEAFPANTGEVLVSVRALGEKIQLKVKDNGKGIPPAVLAKLGEAGVSHGKEGTQSGSGLGVYHAKKSMEAIGAEFFINSTVGAGTQIDITFPRTQSPSWFLKAIKLEPGSRAFCLDDDLSIHQIWRGRLESLAAGSDNIKILNFTSAEEFKKTIKSLAGTDLSRDFFLIDYELLGQNTNGLDVITELGLRCNVALVTSRYEEPEIKRRCESLQIKLLPKSLAEFVVIEVSEALSL